LRERFQSLRQAEAEDAPSFEATLARAETGRRPRRPRWLWAPAGAAAAAALWLVLVPPGPRPRPAPLDPGRWAMPTDVLLEVPGIELLRDLPAIGPGGDGASSPRTNENREIPG
jgi:hypothetical protein